MDHNNRAFVKDLAIWFSQEFKCDATDIVITSRGQIAMASITIPGTVITSRQYLERRAKSDLELKVILTKHGY